MVDHLEGEGYLSGDPEFQTLQLTPQAGQVLYHGKTVSMLVERKKEDILPDIPSGKLSAEETDLYDVLRELRGVLAREAGIPAYVVFSNATLADMARKKPATMSEFRRVSGVGEIKAAWYGNAFLQRIRKYLEENE